MCVITRQEMHTTACSSRASHLHVGAWWAFTLLIAATVLSLPRYSNETTVCFSNEMHTTVASRLHVGPARGPAAGPDAVATQ